MHIRSSSFKPYHTLDPRLALGRYDPESHATFAGNRNPHLAWSGAPQGTRSFTLLCWDPEVPSEGSRVNQEGTTVPLDLPRVDFFHWVLVDLPPTLTEIAEGSHSAGLVPRGKPPGPSPSGGLQGVNSYTDWFAGNDEMAGDWAGYDGPFPPWNDERIHAYRFTIYALDVPSLTLRGAFTGEDVRRAMEGHVLDSAEIVGLYAIWPAATEGR